MRDDMQVFGVGDSPIVGREDPLRRFLRAHLRIVRVLFGATLILGGVGVFLIVPVMGWIAGPVLVLMGLVEVAGVRR